MKPTILFFSLLLFHCLNLKAQIPDLPLSFTNEEVAEFKNRIEPYCLPYIDNEAEIEKHFGNDKNFFGFAIPVNMDILRDAEGYDMNNGCVYIYKIESCTARAIQLFYSSFFLENETYMFVYDEKKSKIVGPLTNADNSIDRIGSYFRGNKITIEYFEPANSPKESTIRINKIMHGL